MTSERAALPEMRMFSGGLRNRVSPNALRMLWGQEEALTGQKPSWKPPLVYTPPPTDKARQRTLTEEATRIYGCCNLWGMCNDEVMSLSFKAQEPFLDWLGWQPSIDCIIERDFLTYVRPEQIQGVCTPGYVADPCGDRNGIEVGTCSFRLEDFGRIGRHGPVRDVSENKERLCERQPRYRLDGSPITSDAEFDLRLITEGIMQDLKRMVITGNHAAAGQFDGLEQLVVTGYVDPEGHRCTSMDSTLIDWNMSPMDGSGAGKTWNGAAIAAGFSLVDVLIAVVRRIRQRISYAPALAAQKLGLGDVALMGPKFLLDCILDAYTCWSVCPTSSWDIGAERRAFRDKLVADVPANLFGDGYITVDGMVIPLVAYDWETIKGPTHGDLYVLTGAVGNVKTINGQWLDQSRGPGVIAQSDKYQTTDGGRLLMWAYNENTCERWTADMRPRMLMWAPFLQARIQDVVCAGPGPVIGPDPCEGSFFIEQSFNPAECESF